MGCMRIKQNSPRCEHCGYDENSQNLVVQLPVGTVLAGQYVVGRVLGQGGFGITYMGYDRNLGLRCAIKEYYPGYMAGRTHQSGVRYSGGRNPEEYSIGLRRFIREARMLAQFQKVPGIAQVYNLFEANDTAYIVMEYVEGVTLTKYIAQNGGRLSAQETMRILGAVMDTLEQVHRREMIHRDISPDNIMLQPDGQVRLLDFGTAKKVEGDETHQTTIVRHGFAPYEQYETHGNVGPWSDLYALCATAYYCMTGRLPASSVMRKLEGTAIDWDSIDGLTERQKQVLRKGSALQASQRYASLGDFRRAFAQEPEPPAPTPNPQPPMPEPEPPTPEPPKPPTPPEPKKPWKKWLTVATLLVVVAGALMFPLMKPDRDTLRADPNTKTSSDGYETMSVFGNENLQRKEIASITFLDTLEDAPGGHWDVSKKQNGSVVAWTEPAGTHEDGFSMYHLYLAAEGGMYAPKSCETLFLGYKNAEQIQFNDAFYTEYVTDMGYMFRGCRSLTTLDVTKFNTSAVTDMGYMFYGCSSLTTLDVTKFDTSAVTDMGYMFRGCSSLTTLDVTKFDTSAVTDMSCMFSGCSSLTTLDVTKFDTSAVTDMSWMFYGCKKLEAQNFDNWDFSGVRYYQFFITTSNVYPNGDWNELFE